MTLDFRGEYLKLNTLSSLDKRNMPLILEWTFILVSGYCLIRNLIALYRVTVEYRKIRRDLDNSYMNMITSIKDNPLDDLV